MDLKDFVKETLVQISTGVKDSQDEIRKLGGSANPASRTSPSSTNQVHLTQLENGQGVYLIDFDVAVNVSEESGVEAGAKLSVASVFSIGGSGTTGSSSTSTNRISFKVPLALPIDVESQKEMLNKEADERAEYEAETRRIANPDIYNL